MIAKKLESKNLAMATRRTTPNTSKERNVPSTNTPQPTRLTPQKFEERRTKGLCFSCDNKYSKGHKCGEKELFYIDCEEEEEQEHESSQAQDIKEITPTIFCHAFVGVSTPQTLKIEGYIKKKKVTVLVVLVVLIISFIVN